MVESTDATSPKLNEARLVSLLGGTFNDHWARKSIDREKVETFHRRDFYTIKDSLTSKRITLLTGPRQTGKTTVIFQLMDDLLSQGIPPERVLYAQMDDTELLNITDDPLLDVLSVYSKYVLKEPLNRLSARIFVFFDEIQHVQKWADSMKTVHDRKYDAKFFISGSSSTELVEASNPLQGRLDRWVMGTLKFSDFATYHLQDKKNRLLTFSLESRKALRRALRDGSVQPFYDELLKQKAGIADLEDRLQILFNTYLVQGGYPALLKEKSYGSMSTLLKTSLDLSVLDMLKRYKVRNPVYFTKILYFLCEAAPKTINYSSLSKAVGVDKVTVAEYVDYLRKAYLVSISSFFARSSARIRKDYKVHINDVGLRNALMNMLRDDTLADSAERGKIIEICTFNHAQRLQYNFSDYTTTDVFYRKLRSVEVDIILGDWKLPLPIEVKTDGTRADDEKTLREFIPAYKAPFGLIVTNQTLKLHDAILLIPAWLFALLC